MQKTTTIKLTCFGNDSSSYSWLQDNIEISKLSYLFYSINKNNNHTIWQQFMTDGLTFQCDSHGISANVTVRAAPLLYPGSSRQFDCGLESANSSQNFVWKKDGKVQEGKTKASELFTFLSDYAAKFFLECLDSKGKNLKTYTVSICAYLKLQQIIKLCSMTLLPVVLLLLSIFALLKDSIIGTTQTSKETRIVVKCSSCNASQNNCGIMSILQHFALPLISILLYVSDVTTDYIGFYKYTSTNKFQWGLATISLVLLSSFVTSSIAAKAVFFDDPMKTFHQYCRPDF